MNKKNLEEKFAQEENDIIAYRIFKKINREERQERFQNITEDLKAKGYQFSEHKNQGKVTFINTDFGTVDYYPKSNRMLFRKENKWIYGGFRWMLDNFLKK